LEIAQERKGVAFHIRVQTSNILYCVM